MKGKEGRKKRKEVEGGSKARKGEKRSMALESTGTETGERGRGHSSEQFFVQEPNPTGSCCSAAVCRV